MTRVLTMHSYQFGCKMRGRRAITTFVTYVFYVLNLLITGVTINNARTLCISFEILE